MLEIASDVQRFVKRFGTRDPYVIADALGIVLLPFESSMVKACYRNVLNNNMIFLSTFLNEEEEKNALCHELGHFVYHKSMARGKKGLLEYTLYDMTSQMEREANIFGAALRIDDKELLDLIFSYGYDMQQCAQTLGTKEAYVAIKIDILIAQGHDKLRAQEYDRKFWNR
jgi:Zn-dependent peptidase ImmA (M78 family)